MWLAQESVFTLTYARRYGYTAGKGRWVRVADKQGLLSESVQHDNLYDTCSLHRRMSLDLH